MSVDALDVHLEGRFAGRLEWDRRTQQPTFTYDDAYRDRTAPTPLSTALPVAGRRHRGEPVAAYLWGLLPDNEVVLDRWGRRFQVSVADPMGLLAEIGTDLPGAVAMVEPDSDLATVDWLDPLTESDIESRLAALRVDQANWLGPDGRWSLGGAQAKLALAEIDGRWVEPSGAFATNRILKPAIPALPGHDLNEHLCLDACRRLGLLVVRSRVQTFGAERAFVVDRYDRATAADGTTQVRIHQEDLCQALGVRPSGKYQSDGGPGSGDVVGLLRRVVDADAAERDIARFVDALIVNWLLAAPDAHAKNYSLLLSGSSVRLAPLYDIASAIPYDDTYAPKVKLAMKIGAYYRVSAIGTSAWTRTAVDLDLDPVAVIDRARSLAERLPAALEDAASTLGDPDAFASRLVDDVAAHVRGCLASLM